MNDDFVRKIAANRSALGLKVTELSKLAGISAKYLYNIEKNADVSNPATRKKNISLEKVRDIILALSLKNINEKAKKFIKDSKDVKTTFFKSKGKEIQLPLEDELNLNTLRDLVFSSIGLEVYSDNFRPTLKDTTKEIEVEKFISTLKGISFDKMQHAYEIWTFSDILTEGFHDISSAERVAANIINYKIAYTYFIPFGHTRGKAAYNNIKDQIEKLLKIAPKNLQEFWKGNKWKEFVKFYELPKVAFFSRFRLYDPKGVVKGNYNVGGTYSTTVSLVDIDVDTVVELRNNLRDIMYEIEANKKTGNTIIKTFDCEGAKSNF